MVAALNTYLNGSETGNGKQRIFEFHRNNTCLTLNKDKEAVFIILRKKREGSKELFG